MSRLDLDRLLHEARPTDPAGVRLERAAVRVLARLAAQEGGVRMGGSPQGSAAPVSRAARRALRARVLAALAAALLLVFALGGSAGPERAGADAGLRATEPALCLQGTPAGGTCEEWIAAALAGDGWARRSLRRSGADGRLCLWAAIEAGQGAALRLLRDGGPPLVEAELTRVAALAVRPELAQSVLDLLAHEPCSVASVHLGRLLVAHAELEARVVAALQRVAARGGRAASLEALLAGAAAGRTLAATAAVGLGSAATVERLLVLLPHETLEGAALARALREALPTLAARVLRRAESGDEGALVWAAAARLEACVPLLHERAVESDERLATRLATGRLSARWALEALASVGTTEAWLAVARSLPAPAGARAQELLAQLDAEAVQALVVRIESSARDRVAGLLALAAGGANGLAALTRLGRRPAYTPDVIDALAGSPCGGASERLVELAARQDSPLPIVEALGRRLAAGHLNAGSALLALGRQGAARAAVVALAAAGEPGERFLALATFDPHLGDEARASRRPGLANALAPASERPRSSVARRSARPY